MRGEGCIVPALFVIFCFGWLVLNDVAKDQELVLVNIEKYPEETFSISEYSLERLEETGSMKIQCGEKIFNVKPKELSKITGDFELSENEVTSCDRF